MPFQPVPNALSVGELGEKKVEERKARLNGRLGCLAVSVLLAAFWRQAPCDLPASSVIGNRWHWAGYLHKENSQSLFFPFILLFVVVFLRSADNMEMSLPALPPGHVSVTVTVECKHPIWWSFCKVELFLIVKGQRGQFFKVIQNITNILNSQFQIHIRIDSSQWGEIYIYNFIYIVFIHWQLG